MKKNKENKKSIRYPLSTLFLVVGTLLLFLNLITRVKLWQNQQLRTEILLQNTQLELANNQAKTPQQITFKGHTQPISQEYYQDGTWTISADTASFLTTASRPSQSGNIIIYGHNKPTIFGPLHAINQGDELMIKTTDNSEYTYVVTEVSTVTPSQVEKLQPTDYEVLTLYTCTGWLDSKRLIIQAQPKP